MSKNQKEGPSLNPRVLEAPLVISSNVIREVEEGRGPGRNLAVWPVLSVSATLSPPPALSHPSRHFQMN